MQNKTKKCSNNTKYKTIQNKMPTALDDGLLVL